MTEPPHRHHTLDYIEIPVVDVATAKEFYGSAFGWTFTDYGPDYAGIQDPSRGAEVAGSPRRTRSVPAVCSCCSSQMISTPASKPSSSPAEAL